jgi:hypothetical protein
MKTFSIIFWVGSCVTLCAQQAAQEKPADVGGWSTTRWGMTLAEIRATAGYPVEMLEDSPAEFPYNGRQIGIRRIEVEIGDWRIPVRVEFLSPADARLNGVDLIVGNDCPRKRTFESLKQSLIEKYGKPADQNSSTTRSIQGVVIVLQTVLWSFPSTSIKLSWDEGGGIGMVVILYRQILKKPLL